MMAKLFVDFPIFVQELIVAGALDMIPVAVLPILVRVIVHSVVVPIGHVVAITNVAICVVIASVGGVIGIAVASILTIVVDLPVIVVAAIGAAGGRVIIPIVVVPANAAIQIAIACVTCVVVESILLRHERIRALIQPLLEVLMLLQV